ncbi:MAG: acyl-CoA dehydrogenase family protein [Candidatus Binatia bacterium]
MNFEFSAKEKSFLQDVEKFLDRYDTPDVMDVTRENMAQLVDTAPRKAFLSKCAEQGWFGMGWPKEYGGSEQEGVYEFLLNESLARRGAPQIGKGVGIVGKTIIRHGNEKLKKEFLPKILRNEIQFAIGYTEPSAGSDSAAMKLKATRDGDGWRLNGQKIFSTSAHFADWYWVGARTDPTNKHRGITLFLLNMDTPGLTVQPMPTIGDETTNSVFFDNVYVSDDYRVGELNRGFQYISEALDLERFTMFAFAPSEERMEELCNYVATETRDGTPLREDPVVRQRIAQLVTQTEVARMLCLRFVAKSMKGGAAPTTDASQYKLYTTELSKRLADAALDIASPGAQLRVQEAEAPMRGRAESTYRCAVNYTIGAGSSEVQKNIIAKRKLGLPPNF